ncbi:histidine--tRNA ligase [Maribacter polysiphoniae]|uniref:histidine--tRNA ligase n=1 Tax=Maribacter polysiphoniae TaxID=429344 RepID=UPI002353DEA8|nr:histidine--tRNA ligase [Maribacter polysiphoniae]
MAQKPSIPKGTRDFSPTEIAKRDYIFEIVKKHFKIFGFQPIETPSFENSETLMGKYGDEGDRLIFKILNSGDYISKVDDATYSSKDSKSLTAKISEKALRYDLTVPFARYVVMHQNEIDFPFKRYQIQPVWRADRPQKGRFREFYQCDADVVGSNSLLQEVELIQLYDAVFTDLKLEGVTIKLNNRKILAGIAEVIGAQDNLVNFTVALDKLDKIGVEGVQKEMLAKGISEEAIAKAAPLFDLSGDNASQLEALEQLLADSTQGSKGVEELGFIINAIGDLDLESANLKIDVTLARGLNYYTGAIFEVGAPEGVKMGSIGGGGRYDDLTGIFGLKDVSGVGISFGLDRIYLVLEELDLFPETLDKSLDVLCINFGERESMSALALVTQLRKQGVTADVYPSKAKMHKQMKYANNRKVPFVVLIGENEMNTKTFVVKDMASGEQHTYGLDEINDFIKGL